MNANRTTEIVSQIDAFSKGKYTKKELLPEMLRLQQEIVRLTFNESHADTAGLRIWDVVVHLEQLNNEHGNVADDELNKFKNDPNHKIYCLFKYGRNYKLHEVNKNDFFANNYLSAMTYRVRIRVAE